MRKLFLFLALLFVNFITAQEKLLEISNDLKVGIDKVHTAFTISDEETGNFGVFLDDENKLYGFLYNSSLELINRITSEGLPRKYSQIIGYSIKNQKIRLFLNDNKDKRFGSVLFDFVNGTTKETLYDFKLKDEVYVEGYNDFSRFYLITMTKESSVFNLYVFEEGKPFTKEIIDLSQERFIDNFGNQQNLNRIMAWGGEREPDGGSFSLKVDKIDSDSPNSIEGTTENIKFYPGKSGFLLTSETDKHTLLFDISTKDLTYSLTRIERPKLPEKSPNSNSFIIDNKIFHISSTKNQMLFSVTSLDGKKELKNILINKDEEINFKNTPIIQEGGAYKSYRELDKTSKFLRRLGRENIGIAVTKSKNDYIVTIGAKVDIPSGGMMMSGFGMPLATAGAFTVTFNPTSFAYSSYSGTKATRIKCLFDYDFNHIDGNIPENVFDRIRNMSDEIKNKDAETVFKLNNHYVWGFYDKKTDKYILYQF